MKIKAKNGPSIKDWVYKCEKLTQPNRIHWCDGSDAEYKTLLDEAVQFGELTRLSSELWPDSFLYRSNPNDVARTEEVTYVCTEKKEEAGPNNNWMNPLDAHRKMDELFEGCMRGRTMYVIPYIMGPNASRYSRCGVKVTDSLYVVLNMRVMTRIGDVALQTLAPFWRPKT